MTVLEFIERHLWWTAGLWLSGCATALALAWQLGSVAKVFFRGR